MTLLLQFQPRWQHFLHQGSQRIRNHGHSLNL